MLPSTHHAFMLDLRFLHKVMQFIIRPFPALTFSGFASLPWISSPLKEEAWIDHWEQAGGKVKQHERTTAFPASTCLSDTQPF